MGRGRPPRCRPARRSETRSLKNTTNKHYSLITIRFRNKFPETCSTRGVAEVLILFPRKNDHESTRVLPHPSFIRRSYLDDLLAPLKILKQHHRTPEIPTAETFGATAAPLQQSRYCRVPPLDLCTVQHISQLPKKTTQQGSSQHISYPSANLGVWCHDTENDNHTI